MMGSDPVFLSLKIAFSGMVFFAFLNYAYICMKAPARSTLYLLTIVSAALLYTLSDTLLDYFAFQPPCPGLTVALLLGRDLVPLVFFPLVPFLLHRLFNFSGNMKRINTIMSTTGLAAAILLSGFIIRAVASFDRMAPTGPALIPLPECMHNGSDILFAFFLFYAIFIILIHEVKGQSRFPVRTILIGLVVISYVVFHRAYIWIFSGGGTDGMFGGFPLFTLCVILLVLFMSFSMTDISVITGTRLADMRHTIDSVLYIDHFLKIPNRQGFKRDLEKEAGNIANHDRGATLYFIDIDDFQNINESYGEAVGNEILRMLSLRISENFSHMGTLYRTGGDEFLLFQKKTDEQSALNLALKILSSMRNPFTLGKELYTLTVSIAILMAPRDGSDADTILSNAFSAIRLAKKKKNTCVFFNETLLEGSTRKINMVNLLRKCIIRDEFLLHYQPIVDREGALVSAEALLRCTNTNPEIGGPGNFIPLLEKAGLMKDLDNLVVRKAFHDMERKIKNRITVNINMSAAQLVDPAYGAFLASFAGQHSIDPGQLVLEITENTLVDNIAMARENLVELKRHGFRIAVDDFGKGFSSLSYLAELPADILKIDMYFIQSVPGDRKREMLAKYIIDLGKSLNFSVLAEGFEIPEQVDFFKEMGCDLFQGYYFSRPLPLQDLIKKYSLE